MPSPRPSVRALSGAATLAAAITVGAAAPAGAAYLDNGGFETVAGNDFGAWNEDAATTVSDSPTVISGSHSAKITRAASGNNQLVQDINDPDGDLADWVFETDLVVLPHASSRSFQVNLYHSASTSSNNINLIVKTVGGVSELWVHNGSTWVEDLLIGAIDYATDTDLDGDFTDAGDSLVVNTLRVTGHYAGATPTFDIEVVDADNVTHTVTGLDHWQGADPVAGDARLSRVGYQAGNLQSGNPAYYYVVDNASVSVVPEPASLALMAVGAGLVLTRRRA